MCKNSINKVKLTQKIIQNCDGNVIKRLNAAAPAAHAPKKLAT